MKDKLHYFVLIIILTLVMSFFTIVYEQRPWAREIQTITEPFEIKMPMIEWMESRIDWEQIFKKQLDCLTKNIYHEAAGEPVEGKIAVAQVTLNRVSSGLFPNNVCDVVYQKTINARNLVVCQFSWFCMEDRRNKKIPRPEWKENYRVAKMVLIDGVRLPELEAAMFYHADWIDPKWRRPQITKIGAHIFYE
jgi:spore germination cell wall hydrolase CwlJ-like protein